MPKVGEHNAPIEADDHLGSYRAVFLGDGAGLTQFGANHETIGPGAKSALPHWHSDEDEFVYMLSGEVTVHEGDETYSLRAGEAVAFKAGVPKGHYLSNDGDAEAVYLVVGTRADRDTITYPQHDRVLIRDRTADSKTWQTLEGKPADDPYAGY